MSFNIIPTDKFQKQVKKLYKKYKSILIDIESLASEISENYNLGTDLGNNIYKIRIAIKSKGKGKARWSNYLLCCNSRKRNISYCNL